MLEKLKKWKNQKTCKEEVFEYIEKYKKLCNGEMPAGRLIGRVFNLSHSRGKQYIDKYKKHIKK